VPVRIKKAVTRDRLIIGGVFDFPWAHRCE